VHECAKRMNVLRVHDVGLACLESFFKPFGLNVVSVPAQEAIPGSHWGDEEAGLIRHSLYARDDTPVHSVFHEACHWLLMSQERRDALHTNAGGSMAEENAVCYLQIVLSEHLDVMGKARMLQDMDTWGYTFRMGSAQKWFEQDADDAREFLLANPFVTQFDLHIP